MNVDEISVLIVDSNEHIRWSSDSEAEIGRHVGIRLDPGSLRPLGRVLASKERAAVRLTTAEGRKQCWYLVPYQRSRVFCLHERHPPFESWIAVVRDER